MIEPMTFECAGYGDISYMDGCKWYWAWQRPWFQN